MTFTIAEKLQITMLCDIAKPAGKRELDYDFIFNAVVNDDIWALNWKYSGLQLNVPTPSEVQLVCDILEMWDRLEEGFSKLSPEEQEKVKAGTYGGGEPHFRGFDGNNETDSMHIARLLIRDLDRWNRFKDRELNAHMPSIEAYERMLAVWQPIWEQKIQQMGDYSLSADEITAVMRERIHPSSRR